MRSDCARRRRGAGGLRGEPAAGLLYDLWRSILRRLVYRYGARNGQSRNRKHHPTVIQQISLISIVYTGVGDDDSLPFSSIDIVAVH